MSQSFRYLPRNKFSRVAVRQSKQRTVSFPIHLFALRDKGNTPTGTKSLFEYTQRGIVRDKAHGAEQESVEVCASLIFRIKERRSTVGDFHFSCVLVSVISEEFIHS